VRQEQVKRREVVSLAETFFRIIVLREVVGSEDDEEEEGEGNSSPGYQLRRQARSAAQEQ
jgi:hypothetical protein